MAELPGPPRKRILAAWLQSLALYAAAWHAEVCKAQQNDSVARGFGPAGYPNDRMCGTRRCTTTETPARAAPERGAVVERPSTVI